MNATDYITITTAAVSQLNPSCELWTYLTGRRKEKTV